MAKYFIDTEFLEGTQDKTIFGIKYGQTKPTIDLISIGIVSEDGREYYAISKDFNLKEAWNRYDIKKKWYSIDESTQSTKDVKVYWIRENVLKPIYDDLCAKRSTYEKTYHWELAEPLSYKSMKYLINRYGKTNKQIAEEIKKFCQKGENKVLYHNDEKLGYDAEHPGSKYIFSKYTYQSKNPEFYGYYSDYDWVAFCWLFGRMMDLPKGFPMYCIDLKQDIDGIDLKAVSSDNFLNPDWLSDIKNHPDYPKQTNEHNALADARWNRELHKFLESL